MKFSVKRPKKKLIIRYKSPSFKIHMKSSTYELLMMFCKFLANNFLLICAIAWMVMIFMFSNQPAQASASLSGNVYNSLSNVAFLKWFFAIIPIRKCGHLFLYFGLSILSFLHFRRKVNHPHLLTLAITYIYACTDELHQYFVDGRGALFTDTLIDLGGAIIGLIVVSITAKTIFTISQKKYEKMYDLKQVA